MRIRGNESGVSKIKVLVVLAVLGIAFNEGIKYLSVQLDFHRMKDAMTAKASVAQALKDDEIRTELARTAKELDLPLTVEHFIIVRDEAKGRMAIKTAWAVDVRYLWGVCGQRCFQRYQFNPVADESYATR